VVGPAAETDKALVPAPTGVSPAATAEQKHNEKNDQYGFHGSASLVRGSWSTRLTSSVVSILRKTALSRNLLTRAFLLDFCKTVRWPPARPPHLSTGIIGNDCSIFLTMPCVSGQYSESLKDHNRPLSFSKGPADLSSLGVNLCLRLRF
jgi:hypothetical protein